jgi:hypothetical protein
MKKWVMKKPIPCCCLPSDGGNFARTIAGTPKEPTTDNVKSIPE